MTIRSTVNLTSIQIKHSLNDLLNRSKSNLAKNPAIVDINSPKGMDIASKTREDFMNRNPFDGSKCDIVELSSGITQTPCSYVCEAKDQYLTFSDILQKSGFYDGMSDEQVKKTEDLLQEITNVMDNLRFGGLHERMSHSAVQIGLESSVLALRTFADKNISDDKLKADFNALVDEYHSFNAERVGQYKWLEDRSLMNQKRTLELVESVHKAKGLEPPKKNDPMGVAPATDVLCNVTHTKEETDKYNETVKALLSQLTDKTLSKEGVINDIQKTMFDYLSGGSKDSNVLNYLSKMSSNLFGEMLSYWNKLT